MATAQGGMKTMYEEKNRMIVEMKKMKEDLEEALNDNQSLKE